MLQPDGHSHAGCLWKHVVAPLQVVRGLEVPTFVVYIASFIFFGAGLAGISYGIFSTSWDPRRQGSLLGTDELKENLPAWRDRNKK